VSARARQRELAVQTRLWATFERRITPAMARLESRIVRDSLDYFERGGISASEGWIDDTAPKQWFEILAPHNTRVVRTFADRTQTQLDGKSWDAVAALQFKADPAERFTLDFLETLLDWVQSEGLKNAKRIAGTTKTVMRELIGALQEEGLSVRAIARRMRIDAPLLGRTRAIVIARTETHNAAMFAGQEAAKSTGLELEKVWLAHGGPRTRDTHLEANEQRQKIDTPYTVGGYQLLRPGDSSLGAPAEEVIQCRCGEAHEPVRG